MPEAVYQAPAFQALHPLTLLWQEAAFAGPEPALGIVWADTDVAVFWRYVHVAHHQHGLVIAKLAFEQCLQVGVETLLGRKLGGVVTAFALREIAVHDGDGVALVVGEGAPDETALSVFFVRCEPLVKAQGCLARQQGDTVVALLPVVMHVIAQGLDLG